MKTIPPPYDGSTESNIVRRLAENPLLYATCLAVGCPRHHRAPDCPLRAFEGMTLGQITAALKALGDSKLSELLQQHVECMVQGRVSMVAPAPGKSPRKLVIILAEDDAHTRLSLELTLKRAGHSVRVAESADALLDLLQTMTEAERAQIDLLVTDLIMPGTMGEELIRKLDARGFVLPVVIITAYGSAELEAEFRRRGNVVFLNKPFHPDDLVFAVQETRLRFEMGKESSAQPDASGAQTTVLVADDSDAFRTRLAALVHHVPGVSAVVQASSASEVWECLRGACPRVALIDVQLDDRGGGVLIRRIKKEFPDLVLVALTRFAGAQLAATYQDCGADQCFDKTTELGDIIKTIAQLTRPIMKNETQKEIP